MSVRSYAEDFEGCAEGVCGVDVRRCAFGTLGPGALHAVRRGGFEAVRACFGDVECIVYGFARGSGGDVTAGFLGECAACFHFVQDEGGGVVVNRKHTALFEVGDGGFVEGFKAQHPGVWECHVLRAYFKVEVYGSVAHGSCFRGRGCGLRAGGVGAAFFPCAADKLFEGRQGFV